MAGHGRRIIGSVFVLGLVALLLWCAYNFSRAQPPHIQSAQMAKTTPSLTTTPVIESIPSKPNDTPIAPDAPVAELHPWPQWGGALNSAEFSGQSFFDRKKAHAFSDSIDPELRRYVVNLNARSLLPLSAESRDALSKTMFPEGAASKAGEATLVYMQFLDHPTDAQKALLKNIGVELVTYLDGYAWTARGERSAVLAAADLPFFRALAVVDPRDKMLPSVYAQQTPSHALAPDGSTRFRVLAVPGTTADALAAQWASSPDLAALEVTTGAPCVLGPRFEVCAPAALAVRMASAARVACIEYTAPPMAPRDATTDSTSNITLVRDKGDKLDGTGITVAVREIGKPEQHVDYFSRALYIDVDGDTTTQAVYEHATSVVGQIASSGVVQPSAKGVAPNAKVLIYSLTGTNENFATNDIADAASRGARISNHSYGPVVKPKNMGGVYGNYDSDSANWDAAIQANNLLCFFAGNENAPQFFGDIDSFVGMKNGLCIEASSALANAGNVTTPKSDGIADFAQFGPMNDGRIKPDLVAFGDNVILDVGTNGMTMNTGTSFSTPACTGVATLVFQRYKAVYGAEPSAALTKALLCDTATDLGLPGPDSTYGFGIINASAAITLVDVRATNPSATVFVENTVSNGSTQTYQIAVPANTPTLRATLCWMDQPGAPVAPKALVNDLDLLIIDPNGVKYYPYSLSASQASAAATNTAPNTVDPIEQTVVSNPIAGTWTVTISGTSVPSGPQAYAFCTNIPLATGLSAAASASPTSGQSPLTVFFSGGASSGAIASYTWNFGDGTTGTGAQISHTYSTGNYSATLTVTDNLGKTSTSSGISIVVTPSTLKALAVAVPTTGDAPLTVQFSAAPSTGNITNYTWNFGDGTFGNGIQISHVYPLGSYSGVTLTVNDAAGHSDTYKLPQINAVKHLDITTYPAKALAKVNLSAGKSASNQLTLSMIVPALVLTPQQSRDAIKNGTFEGKSYTVNVGLAGGTLTPLYKFLVDRHLSQINPADKFSVNLRTGTATLNFKNVAGVSDLTALFKSFGITPTTATLQFTIRVQIETDNVIYQSDYTVTYSGKGGTGTIKNGNR